MSDRGQSEEEFEESSRVVKLWAAFLGLSSSGEVVRAAGKETNRADANAVRLRPHPSTISHLRCGPIRRRPQNFVWSIRRAFRSVWGLGAVSVRLHALVDYLFSASARMLDVDDLGHARYPGTRTFPVLSV